MNILLLLAHSIEEHDQLRLLSGLGYDVFSIGGYIDPAHPHDPKRPGLPDVPFHPELKAVIDGLGTDDNLTAAKEHLPDALIDWADVIIAHHYLERWIVPQWQRIRHKRVIWRTVGQSVTYNEELMAPLRRDGLEVIRYSPRERNIPGFVGEDALIRFYKDPTEWYGWTGQDPLVINITQNLAQRDPYTNFGFWTQVTQGLPHLALGPGSEAIGGSGQVTFNEMKTWLRRSRAYLYTGTQPASYTLGLIEAMMTGIPIVSIGPEHMNVFPYGPELFEGHEIIRQTPLTADEARYAIKRLLDSSAYALEQSNQIRKRAIELFGMKTIGRQWRDYLGDPAKAAAA